MCAYDSQGATMETGNTFSNILKKQITQLEAGHVFPNFWREPLICERSWKFMSLYPPQIEI